MSKVDERGWDPGSPVLPLVRVSLLMPFVEDLDRRGIDADALLRSNGLVRETLRDPDVFVPVIIIHRFLEDGARACEDRHFGLKIGERLDLASWLPFVDAVSPTATLGELLARFIRAAKDEATSARHVLEIEPVHSYFREVRTTAQEILPAQNDAFTAGYLLGLLRRGAGDQWDPKQVRITVCDPAALPPRYLGVHILGGDRTGMVIRFPTGWLFETIRREALIGDGPEEGERLRVPAGFLDALRQTLLIHLSEPELGVDLVARLSGISRQTLQRRLRSRGTTLSSEIREVKRLRACELMAGSDKTVVEVAAELGFTNPTSFARAFKAWTGESPRGYRKRRLGHRAKNEGS